MSCRTALSIFYCPLPFVEIDGVRLDVHGGVVSPE